MTELMTARPPSFSQPRLKDGEFGGVQHDRQGGGGGEASGQLGHVGDAVAAHVVDAQVEHVRALADLVARHLDTVVPAALEHRLAELLRPVGVRPLTDRHVRGVLTERHRLIEGGGTRIGPRFTGRWGQVTDAFDDAAQVLRGGAAAAADQGQTVVGDELLLRVGEFDGGQRVVGAVLAEDGQSGVGHAGQRDTGVAGEMAQVLAHLGRAGGAVEADHVDAERFERGERRADLGAEQHGAGGLDRHRADQRRAAAGGVHGAAGADDRGLGLQQVLRRLHQQRVRAAGDQALGVRLVGVAQHGVGGVAEGGELGAGAHRAQHPPLLPGGGRVGVGDLAGDPGARLGQFVDPLGDVVLPQCGVVGAEGVGLHAVDADVEVRLVDGADDVGAGDIEDLVAALEVLEVLQRRILRLEHGAHRAVGHHDPGGERFAQGVDTGAGHSCSPSPEASRRAASKP
ncbi:UNVERIFIED_CONTAM: hypothetical protein RKD43_007273 [Streptomyces graminofaciens]